MKKLLILLFSILISFNSYGKWTNLIESEGNNFYIDIDLIKAHGGYVYWWQMIDYLKPFKTGTLSNKAYQQGDCGIDRKKVLSIIFYNQPMGRGAGDPFTPPDEWQYPTPGSNGAAMLEYVCGCVAKNYQGC